MRQRQNLFLLCCILVLNTEPTWAQFPHAFNLINTPTPTYVQKSERNQTANTSTIATPNFTANVTAGNLIVCAFNYHSTVTQISSIASSAGDTFVKGDGPITNLGWSAEMWYKEGVVGGASYSVTATFDATSNIRRNISCLEYSGVATTGALIGTANGSDTDGTPSSISVGPINATNVHSLAVGHFANWGAITDGPGFNRRSALDGDPTVDQTFTTNGNQNITATVSAGWAGIFLLFKHK